VFIAFIAFFVFIFVFLQCFDTVGLLTCKTVS